MRIKIRFVTRPFTIGRLDGLKIVIVRFLFIAVIYALVISIGVMVRRVLRRCRGEDRGQQRTTLLEIEEKAVRYLKDCAGAARPSRPCAPIATGIAAR